MNVRSLCYSSFKIIAVWIFMDSVIKYFFSSLMILFTGLNSEYNYAIIIEFFFYTAMSCILWLGANKFSKLIAENYLQDEESEEIEGLLENNFLRIGITLVGIYVLLIQIPYLINNTITYFKYSSPGLEVPIPVISGIFEAVAAIIIAIFLINGTDAILSVIIKLRTVGINKE